jgi:serine/threonine protein kinase
VANDLQNAPVLGQKKKFPRPFGRYILEKSLSRGGMGEVMLAVPKGVSSRCVIKTIRGDLTGDEEFVGRFADEAKIMVRMTHDNIIRVFDAGKVDTDYYIAMEFVYGRDLGDVLDRAYERGEPMPMQLGLYVSSKLLDGLGYVHSLTDETGRHMGLVHRDISPQNGLIGFDGSVKLIDFGLARTDILPARTQGALAVGKYGYMSPEQARHERIDGRADIYSAGVMLFEVFTGDRLVDEQDQATLWQRVLQPKHRNPRSVVPGLPKDIDELIMTAVAVRPDDRYHDALDMKAFVEKIRSQSQSSKERFIEYLRVLYPKADFNPPPMPDLGSLNEGQDKSIIIATSREAQRSVFGRGELAIEGTMQFDASELRAALKKRPKSAWDRDKNRTEAGPAASPKGEQEVEATYIRPTDDPTTGSIKIAIDAPTQIAHFPQSSMGTEETVFSRPTSPTTGEHSRHGSTSEHTLESAPVVNLPAAHQFRDDEMTVMMDAPPRVSRDLDEEDGDAPTRLSKLQRDGGAPVPSVSIPPPASTRSRDIKEKARPDVVERNRVDEPRRKDPAKDKKIAVHRATVPQQADFASEATRSIAEHAPRSVEHTIQEGNNKVGWVLPGVILIGVAFLVFVVVMLVLGS